MISKTHSSFRMKLPGLLIALVCLSFTAFAAKPLSEDRVVEIIAMQHEDKLNEPALKIYPKARKYEITVTSTDASGPNASGKVTATEKWVDGRYIVSEVQPAGPETRFGMVVEFDADSKRYRKYMVMGGKLIGYQEGIRVGDSRSVAWIDLTKSKFEPGIDTLATETHTDTGTTWNAVSYVKGEFMRSEIGVAVVVKP